MVPPWVTPPALSPPPPFPITLWGADAKYGPSPIPKETRTQPLAPPPPQGPYFPSGLLRCLLAAWTVRRCSSCQPASQQLPGFPGCWAQLPQCDPRVGWAQSDRSAGIYIHEKIPVVSTEGSEVRAMPLDWPLGSGLGGFRGCLLTPRRAEGRRGGAGKGFLHPTFCWLSLRLRAWRARLS